MTVDKRLPPHDSTEIGVGVILQNAPVNDEYVKRYLPLYASVNKQYDHLFEVISKCSTLKNEKAKRDCDHAIEVERTIVRKNSDAVMFNYAKANPKSPILPWLLYFKVFQNGFRDTYQNVYQQIAPYIPANINTSLSAYLTKQKLKANGYPFPLADFVKKNLTKDVSKNKYILVDFWFSGCAPCIAQFEDLRKVYSKFHKKDFEMITVSIDGQATLPAYKKLLETKRYPWLQILDLNGVKTNTMDINSFPSGFLLDEHWKIIDTHINPTKLNRFFEDHLR